MAIGDRIREVRKAVGLTQEDVARRAGLTLKAVGELERSEVQDPHISSLAKISRALGVEVADLLREPVPFLGEAPETGQPEDKAPEPRQREDAAPAELGVPMPGTSGHAWRVQITEGNEPTRVEITKTSFFELMRSVKAGRISEEDAWQRFQEEAG